MRSSAPLATHTGCCNQRSRRSSTRASGLGRCCRLVPDHAGSVNAIRPCGPAADVRRWPAPMGAAPGHVQLADMTLPTLCALALLPSNRIAVVTTRHIRIKAAARYPPINALPRSGGRERLHPQAALTVLSIGGRRRVRAGCVAGDSTHCLDLHIVSRSVVALSGTAFLALRPHDPAPPRPP